MRTGRWILAIATTLLALCLGEAHAGPAPDAQRTYLELGGIPGPATRAYMAEVAPPGYAAVRLYVEETGSGPPLLFLHGLGASGYALRLLTPHLARSHRVITLDLRGFGRSDKPFDQSYAALDQVAHVKEFILRRGLRNITLAGHSFGGGVAIGLTLELNRIDPGRIARLVLMNAPAFPQPLSRAVGFLRTPVVPYLALNLIPPEVTAQMSLSPSMGNFAHITERDVASYAMPLRDAAAAHALIITAQRIVPENLPDLVRRYPSISQPTLLIWCRKDPIVPLVTGVSLNRMLPHASLRIIDGCVHVPTEEAAAETLMHMQMFLAGHR